MYRCAPTSIQLHTPAFNVVTFYFTETFPHCNLPIRRERNSARGSFSQLHAGALAACGVQPAAGWVPGRVQRVLRDTYNRQFTFTGVTGASKFGTCSTAAVLEY